MRRAVLLSLLVVAAVFSCRRGARERQRGFAAGLARFGVDEAGQARGVGLAERGIFASSGVLVLAAGAATAADEVGLSSPPSPPPQAATDTTSARATRPAMRDELMRVRRCMALLLGLWGLNGRWSAVDEQAGGALV
jgi:hypothetical protein